MEEGIHIGTSGFFYEHWNHVFYPEELKREGRLPYYATFFSAVEINSTFYHLPKEESVKNWAKRVPKEFVFALKASRYMTHLKRLLECEEALDTFLKKAVLLKKKLGPILFQLPPSFQRDDERLKEFLELLPTRYEYAFEFRHQTWENTASYALLEKYGIALCISDLAGHLSPAVVTAPFVYVRLHGPKKAYRDSYSDSSLRKWSDRMMAWKEEGIETYCFFDNDEKGYAIRDALRLQKKIRGE